MPAPVLIGLHYSPWTEKARWALDHHRVAYRYREHLPLLAEPLLRWRTPRGVRPSVPMLREDGETTVDSFAIAKRAEALGTGPPLFPAAMADEIASWNETSEAVLRVGRAFVLRKRHGDAEALRESLPAFIPGFARGALTFAARGGGRFIGKKHAASREPDREAELTVVPAFERLRGALGGRATLGDGFTYADVTMSVALQFLRPPDARFLAMGEGTRRTWTHDALATRFADLLDWRDALYASHRKPSAAAL